MIKPEFVDGVSKPICKQTLDETIEFFEDILRVIHPWMPFISEELWHLVKNRKEKECLIVSNWPTGDNFDKNLLSGFNIASEIIQQLRNVRKQKSISPKESLELFIRSETTFDQSFNEIIVRLSNLRSFTSINQKPENAMRRLKT